MSVFVTVRLAADPDKAQAIAAANPERMRAIRNDALEHGLIHHHFATCDGEILANDEWENAEGFKAFFSGNQLIPELMQDVGVTSEPEIKIWDRLEMYDDA